MARAPGRQTDKDLVDAKTQLPRYKRDELDKRAAAEGMRRATYLRRLVFRDLEGSST